MGDLGGAHQAAARDAQHIIQQQSALSAKAICHPTATETTEHATNRKYWHRYRPQMLDKIIADILVVAIFVHIFDEILDIFAGCIDHARIEAKLQHTKYSRKYGIRQEESEPLLGITKRGGKDKEKENNTKTNENRIMA